MRHFRKLLPFLEGERLRAAFGKTSYIVRIFHPRGAYPRARVLRQDSLYWADDEIVFMVNLATPWRVFDENAPYSEMDWLMPEEMRFLGSLFLCQKTEEAKLSFYPLHSFAPRFVRKSLKLSSIRTAQRVRDSVVHAVQYPPHGHYAQEAHECASLRYRLIAAKEFSLESQPEYWRAISPKNYVLLRGIAALLKSDMLACYREFIEEAAIQAFIALDASFQLILRLLKEQGAKDPDAKAAARWLFEHFDKLLGFEVQQVERYFEDFYDQRIMTFHPASRFGDTPYAPLLVDDFYDLRGALPDIFAYLVRGKHAEGFLEAAQRARSRRF